ncbi:MAG TPA: hypothetical protein VLA12_21525, partial [Planctomycetaceae bacterium]|nr:hypothetical protein [Planctomycetaceae bacterium]
MTDGFRSGARLVAKDGRITAGEPLEIQYLLKNETDIAQSLDLVRSSPAFPSLEEGNRIDLSLFPAHEKPQTRTLQAGEVWDDSQNRDSIDTTGFPAGTYVVSVDSFFLRPDPEDSNRKSGIPIRGSISVVIESEKSTRSEPDPETIVTQDDIAWGKPVAGVQVGSRFVGEAREFAIPSDPQIQLFVRNVTRTPIEVDVMLPHSNDGWLLNMENDRGEHVMLARTPIDLFWAEQSYRMTLAQSETIPITGAERTVNFGPTNIKHATFGIAKEKPSEGLWNGGVLITNGGQYKSKLTVSLKRVDMPGLRLRLDAAALAFQVNGPELKEEDARPVTLHGFNLAPYRASKNREELQKTEPILDRNRPHAEGGSWRCWLDSAENYNQWLVCYDPNKQIFYVVDEKSEDRIVYGPIPGDAIEKLWLLDGSSDLVAAKADEQNVARAANLHVRRIQSLLESHDISLQSHGLKAFVELGDLKIYELRNWSERIEKVADSEAGRDQLKPLVGAAEKYLREQHDRIEALKVQLDDSEYKRGRQPTQAELDADWGPVSEGLSLAIADWPRDVRKFDVNEQPQITLLVRNTGDSSQRISTLDVLDGVGVIVTDEQSKQSARLDFPHFTGLARTERYLLQPGELVEIKRFSFQIKEGDLHPPGKTYNPRNLEVMYEHINVRPNRTYRLDVTLSMPSAYNSLSNGKITMPAKGEFDGQLVAKPVRLALRDADKDQASDNTTASLSGRIVFDGEPPAQKKLDLLRDAKGVALKNPSAIRVQWNKLGIP